jgi:hypothetical protein
MSTADGSMTDAAFPDFDVELSMDCPPRDLRLVLWNNARLMHLAGTVGVAAVGGKRNLDYFVNVRWRLAMGMSAMILAAFAARSLRVWLGITLGERGGLPLSLSQGGLELGPKGRDLSLKLVVLSLKLVVFCLQAGDLSIASCTSNARR